jgi:hypothetical protein
MVGLPHGVGAGRLVAVDQVEGVGIGLRPLMSQGHQRRIQLTDHGIDGAVARRRLPEPLGEGDGLAMVEAVDRGGFFRARPSMPCRSVSER